MKQYTVETAYTGNYRITTYENGKRIKSGIVSWYEVDGYKIALEEMGYIRADASNVYVFHKKWI